MLAPNYKSAEELGITEDLWGALIKVKGMLEREEVLYRKFSENEISHAVDASKRAPDWFNMQHWATHIHGCGTVMCIGGTCEWLLGRELGGWGDREDASELFCPEGIPWETITAAQAAVAIGDYLRGDLNWKRATGCE